MPWIVGLGRGPRIGSPLGLGRPVRDSDTARPATATGPAAGAALEATDRRPARRRLHADAARPGLSRIRAASESARLLPARANAPSGRSSHVRAPDRASASSLAPRYASMAAESCKTSATGPAQTTLPVSITTSWSASPTPIDSGSSPGIHRQRRHEWPDTGRISTFAPVGPGWNGTGVPR